MSSSKLSTTRRQTAERTTPKSANPSTRSRSNKPPRQDRSRKTYNALLDAAERLLQEQPWEDISIVEIMLEAKCSNGAIYGRFKSKDDLLVELYERHDEKLKARFERQQKRSTRKDETLDQYLSREIDQLIKTMRQNRWLFCAMGLLSRTKPEVVSSKIRQERKAMFEHIGSRVLQFETGIDHPDPKRAVELVVFFVATIVREAILYQGPHAETLELSDGELKSSLKQMARGFLGVSNVSELEASRERTKKKAKVKTKVKKRSKK